MKNLIEKIKAWRAEFLLMRQAISLARSGKHLESRKLLDQK